jgi:hemerythrin-like domain-containing protein
MLPIAPLMIEHRLIDRMIAVIQKEITRIENAGAIDPGFIDEAADFIRTYADRCHHGKEEDILFRDLGKRDLTSYDRLMVEELKEDHRKGRENTALLVAAKERYIKGDKAQAGPILDKMKFFVDFYPKHIEKEDKHFFLPSMAYFTEDEKQAMMREETAFDERLIHLIYKERVSAAEKSRQP